MKPSLLFITGWAHSKATLQPLANAFASDFQTTLCTGAEVLKTKKIPDAEIIVAHSMGGILALEHLPTSCKKLILISSTARFCATTDYPCGVAQPLLRRMIKQLKRNPEAVLESFFQNVHHPEVGPSFDPTFDLDSLVLGLEYLQNTDLRDSIQQIKIPVLLLHGTSDLIIPADASTWLHNHLPQSELQLFPSAGHALYKDAQTVGFIQDYLLPG